MLDSLIGEALGEFGMQESIRNKLYDFAYLIITRPAFLEPYAGLVFAGFGEGDVFPVYCHYYASIMVDGVIKRAHFDQLCNTRFKQADISRALRQGGCGQKQAFLQVTRSMGRRGRGQF